MNATRHPFAPHQHLRTTREFQRVYRRGSRARGDLMTVAVMKNDLPHTRLGLSIGKVVWKSAVRRNRVRRVFREAFRLELEHLPQGVDLVLIAQKRAWPELAATRRELVRLSRKASRRYLEKSALEDHSETETGEPRPLGS